MTLPERIAAYVKGEYPGCPHRHEDIIDELIHVLSEGDRVERPWIQHAIEHIELVVSP